MPVPPRRPRVKGNDAYHHIYAWGNDRHPIFKAVPHYEKYLSLLELYSVRHAIDIIAYALMEWHVHLFVYDRFGKISIFMNNLHGEYAFYFNKDAKRVGHVFGERFKNKIVQVNNYGLWLSRYIHRQAVHAGLVDNPEEYQWTSYRAYIGLAPRGFVDPHIILDQFGNRPTACQRYQAFVNDVNDGPVDWNKPGEVILGDKEFAKRFEKKIKQEDACERKESSSDIRKIFKQQCRKLNVKIDLSVTPACRSDRALRVKICRILHREYGFSLRAIGHIINMSATGVWKTIQE
jgi:REP element-mobilizing transposase RayT